MKGKWPLLVVNILLLLCLATVVYASDVTDAIYRATIIITNNSTATENVTTLFDLESQDLIDGNYINNSFNNTAIQTATGSDVPFMPGSDNWSIFVSAIGEDTQLNYVLYTGGSSNMNGQLRYFPGSGGMTTADSAGLEPGDNFTISQEGWVDTTSGADKYTIRKDDAFIAYTDNSGNYTAGINPVMSTANQTLNPSGAGDETNITNVVGAGTHWQAVSDTNDASYVKEPGAAYKRDLYATADSSNTASINSVTIYFRIANGNAGDTTSATPHFKISGSTYTGTVQTVTGITFGTKNQVYNVSPDTSAAWTWAEINAMQTGISIKDGDGAGNGAYASEVYIIVNYDTGWTFDASVTTTGLSDGGYIAVISADSTNMTLTIDGLLEDNVALSGASVVDNANDWVFIENGSMIYMLEQEIEIDGIQQQLIRWEYDTTFTDLSGNGHDATPTFVTANSDPNVSAALQSFQPVTAASVTSFTVEEQAEMISAPPTTPTNLYEDSNVSHLPLANVVNSALSDADIPESLFWITVAYISAAILGMVAFGLVFGNRGRGSLGPSLIAQTAISALVMVFWILTGDGVIPGWTIIPFVLEAVTIIILVRSPVPV